MSQMPNLALNMKWYAAKIKAHTPSHLCVSYMRSKPPKMPSMKFHRLDKIHATAIRESAITPAIKLTVAEVVQVPDGSWSSTVIIEISTMPLTRRSEEHTSELQSRGHLV